MNQQKDVKDRSNIKALIHTIIFVIFWHYMVIINIIRCQCFGPHIKIGFLKAENI